MRRGGRRLTLIVALAVCSVMWALPGFGQEEPAGDAVFTSTRSVTGIVVTPDGTVWASTRGGVLEGRTDGTWHKYTTLDGLPSCEVLGIQTAGDTVTAVTPVGNATWHPADDAGAEGHWAAAADEPAAPTHMPGELCALLCLGNTYVVTVRGFFTMSDAGPKELVLPRSGATAPPALVDGAHITSLLAGRDALWAGVYGGGLAAYDGVTWRAVDPPLPPEACEVTALGGSTEQPWVGTRRAGMWTLTQGRWVQHLQPDEPYDHNCQALAEQGGTLYVSTLQDGLQLYSGGKWTHVGAPTLSSDVPREAVSFQGRLYVRMSDGQVDCCDGGAWTRDVCKDLPRVEVSALATDGARLYAAQWGGWSEFDGKTWDNRLKADPLQGIAVLGLAPEGQVLRVLTERQGLGAFNRVTGAWTWDNELQGLPDDWVRCFLPRGTEQYAGTFVGGLARRSAETWEGIPGLTDGEITALAPDGTDGVLVGTRHGLWRAGPDGPATRLDLPWVSPEVQALLVGTGGVWVGTRTGLFYVPNADLAPPTVSGVGQP